MTAIAPAHGAKGEYLTSAHLLSIRGSHVCLTCYFRPDDDLLLPKELMMARAKTPESGPGPRPGSSWLAGMMIGSAILTLATGAMMVGAGIAVRDVGLKGD